MTDAAPKNLPWFAFNVPKYVADTMRLPTEGHGAYLLLMLDYYGTGTPAPDDDFILAAITKLPEERWVKLRPVLMPFFQIRDGHWHHAYIESEIVRGREAYAKELARTDKARAIWTEQKKAKAAASDKSSDKDSRKPSGKAATKSVTRLVTEPVTDIVTGLQEQEQKHTPTGGSSPPEIVDQVLEGEGERSRPETITDTQIAPDFKPSALVVGAFLSKGLTADQIEYQLLVFIAHHRERGTFSANWDASFEKWMLREVKHLATQVAKAPPRVELNTTPYVPTETELAKAAKLYLKNESTWPRGWGPSPGQSTCRVPPDMLRKVGIDPMTGNALREEAGT